MNFREEAEEDYYGGSEVDADKAILEGKDLMF